MPKAYLTIDDSPTRHTDDLTDWLAARGVPAVLFCIGSNYTDLHVACEGIEQNPDPIRRAIEKGFVIGNHTFTHRRSSEMPLADVVAEIEKTESLIDGLYRAAGRARPVKLVRFPHLDRGAGGWVVDYDAAPAAHQPTLRQLFLGGLNITLAPPTAEQVEKKAAIQDYLKREGFTASAYKGVTLDWYAQGEMATAADSLMTFSTSDWMLNPDFAGYAAKWDWQYKSLDALKGKIDDDADLWREDSAHVILAHDHNRLFETTRDLVQHMQARGMEFVGVA